MAIITLTSDWGNSDYYVGAIKGMILSLDDNIKIVDVSHQVQSFSVGQAAFILQNAFRFYPEKSVHIVEVKSEPTDKSPLLLLEYKNHYFLCADNGFAGLLPELAEEEMPKVWQIKTDNYQDDPFLSMRVFSNVAISICKGEMPGSMLETYDGFKKNVPIQPAIDKDIINGSVLYVDSYGNAITNISESDFKRIGANKAFEMLIQSNFHKVNKINNTYSKVPTGEIVVLFNSSKFLEIAINNGNAARLLNLSVNSSVRVKFFDGTSTPSMKLFNN